ncbi:MAG: hypothetical protein KDA42_16300 [Planctomycetales bacterium]|nr:hypothetical protein [Planctomycetales bacterium]
MASKAPTVEKPLAVVEIVEERLRQSMYLSLRSVSCQFQDGLLTLRGIVPSFYVKQVVLSLLEDLEDQGVERVIDEVNVVNPRGLSSVRNES